MARNQKSKISDSKASALGRGGFTLIEAIAAVGIFAILVSVAVGGFVHALRTEKQIEGLISANSNASLIIEQMAREIRTSSAFCNPAQGEYTDRVPKLIDKSDPVVGCPQPTSSYIFFKNASDSIVLYEWDWKDEAIDRTEWPEGAANSNSGLQMNSDKVAVKYLNFLGGWGMRHPRVTMALGISSKEAGVSGIVTKLETTVSSRAGINPYELSAQ